MKNYKVIEESGLRWYIKDEIYHPSVSTVNGWQKTLSMPPYKRKAGNAANFGTATHFQLAKAIYDDFGVGNTEDILDMPDIAIWNVSHEEKMYKINKPMQMWYKFLAEHSTFEPLQTEMVLFNDGKTPYAGRLDVLCRIDGLIYLIDFKTGAYYPEYDAQVCGGYACLLRYSGLVVDRVALLFLDSREDRNPSGKYNFKVYSDEERSVGEKVFKGKLQTYYENDVRAKVEQGA